MYVQEFTSTNILMPCDLLSQFMNCCCFEIMQARFDPGKDRICIKNNPSLQGFCLSPIYSFINTQIRLEVQNKPLHELNINIHVFDQNIHCINELWQNQT